MSQAKVRKVAHPQATTEAQPETKPSKELVEDIDSILDEIDECLEKNAQDFVKNYVQKGGE